PWAQILMACFPLMRGFRRIPCPVCEIGSEDERVPMIRGLQLAHSSHRNVAIGDERHAPMANGREPGRWMDLSRVAGLETPNHPGIARGYTEQRFVSTTFLMEGTNVS
ncbi:hypothetical protein, partial [uncultured Bifidobacterium sp.]